MWSDQQGISQADFHLETIATEAEINPSSEGWPTIVNAEFFFVMDKPFKVERGGEIRPAPWEPLNTPPTRTIPWPDKKYLVREMRKQ
jgi:hypothetical protein